MTIDTDEQFEKMQAIGRIVANCLEYLKASARPGMTTLDLDHLASKFLKAEGAASAPQSVYNFPGATCISVEKAAAHGIPGDYVLKEGDLINVDVSAFRDGYCADNGESFVIGQGDKLKHKLCATIHEVLSAAVAEAKTGQKIANVGKAAEALAAAHNFTVIRNLGGHGVGTTLHEEPQFIPSYYDSRDRRIFLDKQVVAIEPFISNGATKVKEAKDGWTLYHDHYYTVQKEHTVMVTKNGPYILTKPTKQFS